MNTIKNSIKSIIYINLQWVLLLAAIFISPSCNEDFLYKQPKGVVFTDALNSKTGIDLLLTGAYAAVTGAASTTNQNMSGSASSRNWVWDCASDNAYKGTTFSDTYDVGLIERYEAPNTSDWVRGKWFVSYDGISRANDLLKTLSVVKDKLDPAYAVQIEAQAKFLRGWWHFRLQKVFWQIPYITEDVVPEKVKNDHAVWPEIEKDLQFAIDNLPDSWPGEPGKATKWAAMAYKAYVHLYQHEYSEAKVLLDAIINSNKFDLVTKYRDNFDPNTENNKESIFEIQYCVNDGSGTQTRLGNADSWVTNGLNSVLPTCCGLYQPSQDLVNAFKVDDNGLPLLGINGPKYNDENLENDMGILSTQTFIPTNHLLDPRLDWTVGRRGIPYEDWGIMTGSNWIRSQVNGGPYLTLKAMYYKKDKATASHASYARAHSINFRKLRFSHVLLWRAECAVEENDLETARQLVNRIRKRAADPVNMVMGKVSTYTFTATTIPVVDYTQPAANYKISEYKSFPSQAYAREAVRMEERLEFGMEGNRFFDLVRWGIDYDVLTKFIENDAKFRTFMTGATYTKDKNSRWPIPQVELDLEPGILDQDPLWK